MKNVVKKILVACMAAVMVMGLSVVAFADADGIDVWSYSEAEQGTVEAGQSISLTTTSGGFYFAAHSCEEFDGSWEYTPDKNIKIYYNGKFTEKISGKKLFRGMNTSATEVVTFKYKKGRLDITVTSAAPATPEVKVNPGKSETNTGVNSTTAVKPKTAKEAQTLADYYAAVIKKNKLAGTGAPEEALLAYYQNLAKTLK